MKIIVMGSGIIGVTSAYYLAKSGHEVTVIDKNPDTALSCSMSNGGQLSYSHIDSFLPSNSLLFLIKTLFKRGLFFKAQEISNPDFIKFCLKLYENNKEGNKIKNSINLYNINTLSKLALEEIMQEEEIDFYHKKNGILHFYRNNKLFNSAIKNAIMLEKIGCSVDIFDSQKSVDKVNDLSKLSDNKKLRGGIFFENDQTGDAFIFANKLANICKEKYNVKFEFNSNIKNIFTNYQKITGIHTDKGVISGDIYVYALGSEGLRLINGINVNHNIFPLKGYSISMPISSDFKAPEIGLTDPENKIVYSNLGKNFRAAGTIEISDLNSKINFSRLNFIKKITKDSLKNYGNIDDLSYWQGYRPCRPNLTPYICEVKKFKNLFINSGHGHLGWTMACGSSKILSNKINGKSEKVFDFLDNIN